MESVKNLTWRSRIEEGEIYTTLIRYNASLNNLSVMFTGFSRKRSLHQRVSYIVDLREHLPEWVTFGFSGATGDTTVINSIYKWAFSSNLGINEGTMDPEPETAASPRPKPKPKKIKSGQVIGLVVGIVLFIGLGLGLFMLRRRKRFETTDDIFVLDTELKKVQAQKSFHTKNWPEPQVILQSEKSSVKVGLVGFIKDL